MTAITDILAEAFNRVKNEHGVTLSRVDFEHYSGNLQGVTFTSSGIVRMVYPATGAMPPQMPVQPVQPVPAPNTPPEDATHYGSLDGGDPRYYNYRNGVLLVWGGWVGWCQYASLSDATHAELVEQLTPLANPA